LPSTDKRTPKTYQARKLTLENQQLKWEGFQCISKKSQDCNLLFYLYERQLKRKNRMHGPEGDVSLLWRGDLSPLGRAAALKQSTQSSWHTELSGFGGCCAAQRGGATFR
jgi:hypothetical protein